MHVIIPARYGSTRLRAKPLETFGGKRVIQHVYERALESGAESIIIATDDARIRDAAESFGARTCMTSPAHASGTDRIGEAVAKLGLGPDEIVVNLQGDEGGMPPGLIRQVAQVLAQHPAAAIATASYPIDDAAALIDPNVVKVVCDAQGYALYFSRAPIPWHRDAETRGSYNTRQHIGLYAYRAGFITRFCAWPPSPLEKIEKLEQLRALWYGERIIVCESATKPGPHLETPADLELLRKLYGP